MTTWHTDLQHATRCIRYWHGQGDMETVESMMRFFNGILAEADYEALQDVYRELIKHVWD